MAHVSQVELLTRQLVAHLGNDWEQYQLPLMLAIQNLQAQDVIFTLMQLIKRLEMQQQHTQNLMLANERLKVTINNANVIKSTPIHQLTKKSKSMPNISKPRRSHDQVDEDIRYHTLQTTKIIDTSTLHQMRSMEQKRHINLPPVYRRMSVDPELLRSHAPKSALKSSRPNIPRVPKKVMYEGTDTEDYWEMKQPKRIEPTHRYWQYGNINN